MQSVIKPQESGFFAVARDLTVQRPSRWPQPSVAGMLDKTGLTAPS